VQTPVQASPTQALSHVAAVSHAPSSLHVSTVVLDVQRVWPGRHSPAQPSPTHALAQSIGSDQRPAPEQTRTRTVDRHSVAPGAHSPPHTSSAQTKGHGRGSAHSPSAVHCRLALAETHSVAPAAQAFGASAGSAGSAVPLPPDEESSRVTSSGSRTPSRGSPAALGGSLSPPAPPGCAPTSTIPSTSELCSDASDNLRASIAQPPRASAQPMLHSKM
jgi:hypothetical protein